MSTEAPLVTRRFVVVRGEDIDGDLALDADVVVVGSGAGGAVVAAELAEAGQSVVVVEEGPYVSAEEYGALRPSESMRRMWRDGGLTFAVGLGDTPMINVMMGECIGGSSVATGGVCFRTPGYVLHDWATRLGLVDLDEAKMDACFSAVEKAVHVEEVPEAMRSRSTELFALGATRLGKPVKPLRRNTQGCTGCGRCNFGCPHGAKLSVDVTYLPRAVRAGARVHSDLRVERITSRGGRATGVEGRILRGPRRRRAGRFTVTARRVVVAAGAYATPILLGRSGLGRQSGQLGRNVTLHPGFRMMARFDDSVRGWQGALQSAYSDAYEDDRITLVGLFVPPGVLAGMMPGIGKAHLDAARKIPHLAVFGGMIHDHGGGTVHDVFGKPFLTYRLSPENHSVVPQVLRVLAETFFAAGAKEVFLPVYGLGGIDADRFRRLDLDRIPRSKLECASQHPLGSARLGISGEHAVTKPDGETWELDELFIADGSILPTSLGVNPQLSIMAMATRIAWKLRERKLPA